MYVGPEAHCIQSRSYKDHATTPTADTVLGRAFLPAGAGQGDGHCICCLGDALTPCCPLGFCLHFHFG